MPLLGSKQAQTPIQSMQLPDYKTRQSMTIIIVIEAHQNSSSPWKYFRIQSCNPFYDSCRINHPVDQPLRYLVFLEYDPFLPSLFQFLFIF